MADGDRRTRAVVVALLVGVAVAVLLTLRCVTAKDDADSNSPDVSASAGGATGAESAGTAADGAGDRSAGDAGAPKLSKAPATSRSRAKSAADAAPHATTSSESTGSKPAASMRSPSGDPTYGRFTLVGDKDAYAGRDFGGSVAIDGDVAVIGAPGFKQGDVACGAAFIYERNEGVWTETQRIDSPRWGREGFARQVGVSGRRVVVFDAVARGSTDAGFRSYVPNKDGRWAEEATAFVESGIAYDVAFRGDTVVVPVLHEIEVWRLGESGWERTQRIPDSGSGRSRCLWVALSGDTLAYTRRDEIRSERSTSLFRLRDGSYEPEADIKLTEPIHSGWGTLGRDGAALVNFGESIPVLVVEERSGHEWTRRVAATSAWGQFTAHNSHPVAADGDLVVAASRDWDAFRVLQRRDDGWYWTSMGPKAPVGRHSMWPAWFANVAISGRSVVVGTDLDGSNTGRAWFFDITDEDLARATKVESDAK